MYESGSINKEKIEIYILICMTLIFLVIGYYRILQLFEAEESCPGSRLSNDAA